MYPRHFFRYAFICLMIFSVAACKTFRDRNGRKFHQFALANDYSSVYLSDSSVQPIGEFHPENPDDTDTEALVYLTADAFGKLKEHYAQFVVLYWNAGCSYDRTDTIARNLEDAGVPVILASYNFNLTAARKKVRVSGLKHKVLYVLSPVRKTDKSILRLLYFTREICPECYQFYKDELVYSNGVLYQNGFVQVLFYNDLSLLAQRMGVIR